MSKTISY